jgi:hypothetical protein
MPATCEQDETFDWLCDPTFWEAEHRKHFSPRPSVDARELIEVAIPALEGLLRARLPWQLDLIKDKRSYWDVAVIVCYRDRQTYLIPVRPIRGQDICRLVMIDDIPVYTDHDKALRDIAEAVAHELSTIPGDDAE